MTGSCKATRIILHVDMDHFFSAIEEREHPAFKGQPVVVGADPKEGQGRGVVKTCNYEARAFGIRSGMSISEAWRRCPTAIYVRGDYGLYKDVSATIMRTLMTFSEKFQPWGLDEAFLDVSSEVRDYADATDLAVSVKHDLLWHVNLTCSVGVGPNKLVAKIASDFQKPDGLTVVTDDEVERFLAPLPVRRMLWIGAKTERKLNELGIRTIGDLASCDVAALVERFGVMGRRYHRWAHGVYTSAVGHRRRMRRSMGHERTFATDIVDRDVVLTRLDGLCERIHQRAVKRRMLFKTVTVKVRFGNFQTFTHGKTLRLFTNRLADLQTAARELVQRGLKEPRRIRLVGVRVSNLRSDQGQANLDP